MANILIGCECSGVLRNRFREQGHNAWSCDLKEAEDDTQFHMVGNVVEMILHRPWDLIICHPPCTTLSVSGNHVYAEGKDRHDERLHAIGWTEDLWHMCTSVCDKVAFENPIGVLSTQSALGKATQYIQPYEFGDDASKKTGLWLYNLPKLQPTMRTPGRVVNGKERWSNQTDSGQNRLGPSEGRATERSRTYPGIADAIVNQWGRLL